MLFRSARASSQFDKIFLSLYPSFVNELNSLLKIFVTATPEIRAQRRYDEQKAKREEASFDEILENVKQRDYIDQNRDVSPLRKAEDAILLDNTNLTIEQQKKWLFDNFNKVSE